MAKLVQAQFPNTSIKRREIKLQLPTISVKCLSKENSSIISELVLCKLDMDFHQFLDTRGELELRAHSFYVLYKDQIQKEQEELVQIDDLQPGDSKAADVKCLILGPLSSRRVLQTSKSFYTQ